MNASNVNSEPVALRAWTIACMIDVELTDGRVIGFLADRFQLLSQATDVQLTDVTIAVNGYALRWEQLDEDISVAGIVAGRFQLPLPKRAAA